MKKDNTTMQILFDELGIDPPDYDAANRKFTIDMSFESDDPVVLTAFVKKKLENIRVNIVAWRTTDSEKIAVGVGHYYDSSADFGQPIFPHWWVE